jgi:hypothetical protein
MRECAECGTIIRQAQAVWNPAKSEFLCQECFDKKA